LGTQLQLPSYFQRAAPAEPAELQFLRAAFTDDVPDELICLLEVANGAQGLIRPGEPGPWLVLYSAQEIVIINRQFRRNLSAANELLVFGSDGEKRLAAFDLRLNPSPILAVPVSLLRAEVAFHCATVAELVEIIETYGWEGPESPAPHE
jgi:hypothetical protein